MSLANESNQRGLKDFLTLYNTITAYCFDKCISNFNERNTSFPENSCISTCAENYVQFNQRFMFNFVDHQERRKHDVEMAAAEMAAKNAAEAKPQVIEVSKENLITPEQLENFVNTTSGTDKESLLQSQQQRAEEGS